MAVGRHIRISGVFAAALTAAAVGTAASAEPPVVAEKPGRRPDLFDLRDLMVTHVRTNGEIPAGSRAEALGGAIDTAEKFLRLRPEEMAASESLSPASRDLPESSEGRSRLERMIRLRADRWLRQVADGYLGGDRVAAVIVVFAPRPDHLPKTPDVVYLVRPESGFWQVSFDVESDLPSLGEPERAAYEELHPVVEKRRKEIENVVTRPLGGPLPFRGTWVAHYRQSDVYFTFDGFGEVFVLQAFGNGTTGYGVFDYHLSGDEIAVEWRLGPIRFRRHPSGGWEEDGRWYPTLVADDLRLLFAEYPDYQEGETRLVPARKGGQPIRRPVAEGTDLAKPAP